MPEQLWLPGLEAPPALTDGLFFAVYPHALAAAEIARRGQQLCESLHARGKPLAANRLHVTLRHLGNFAGGLPPEKVQAAMRAAASIVAAPFSIEFDRAASFASKPRPGPLVLCGGEGVVGFHRLHDLLSEALQRAGLEHREVGNAYTPHITLAYGMPWIAEQPVEAIAWNVHEFVLMHSLLGRTRHVALGRWALVSGA